MKAVPVLLIILAVAAAVAIPLALILPAVVGHFLFTLLGWPAGIILGNLLASVVWSSMFEWRMRVHHLRTRQGTDTVADALDTTTDGGLKEVMDLLKKIEAKLDTQQPGA